jgi:hypothetical protein
MIDVTRFSEINRQLSDPMTNHRYEAGRLHSAAQRARRRARRRAFVVRVGRTVTIRGHRIGRTAAAA